jgi:hypothetical protein
MSYELCVMSYELKPLHGVGAQNNYELWIMNYEFLGARRAPIVPRQ